MFSIPENRTIRSAMFFIAALSFTLLNSGNSFFWDSVVQVSLPANWYFDNNIRQLFLPDEIASGHPSFVGMYLALIWKIFGRSLFVSHMAMLPFIYGILLHLYKLIARAGLTTSGSLLIMLVVVCDATLVSQLSMITFDIPQIFFFLWSLNAFFDERSVYL